MTDKAVVEAALYSAGRPLTLDELARVTGYDEGTIKDHLRALSRDYTKRASALEVTSIGSRWTMQIRAEYTEKARPFAPTEIDRDLLKTAALIAYHQPLLQSDLGTMIGEKVYEHTKALEALNLITRKPSGRSLELATTRYFAEFFGLKATGREGIRKLMAERAGIPYHEKTTEDGSSEATMDHNPPADATVPATPGESTSITTS